MRKAAQNYILFIFLFLLGLFQAFTGFILWFVLPRGGLGQGRGSAAAAETTFWSLSRHDWGDIHDWVAVALLVVVIIHIILNWKWITYMTKSYFSRAS